jgi:hypothetical protein
VLVVGVFFNWVPAAKTHAKFCEALAKKNAAPVVSTEDREIEVLKIYLRATAEIESALSSLTQEQRSRVEDYMHARKE